MSLKSVNHLISTLGNMNLFLFFQVKKLQKFLVKHQHLQLLGIPKDIFWHLPVMTNMKEVTVILVLLKFMVSQMILEEKKIKFQC